MAFRIEWAPTATTDLHSIARYIAEHNPNAARSFVRNVFEAIEALCTFPEAGRMVPEFHDATIREIVRRPCRIIYRVSQPRELIEIVRIWHGARGMPTLDQ